MTDRPSAVARHHETAHGLLARAHAPYSHFPVAAVLVTAGGGEFHGVNVENAAYGSTICAERMAVGAMVTAGDRSGIEVVVVAGRGGEPLTPCGPCRQVLAEFSHPDTIVTSRGDDGQVGHWTMADLLPHAFGPLRLAAGAEPTPPGAAPRSDASAGTDT
jgi:cytidine deaminase